MQGRCNCRQTHAVAHCADCRAVFMAHSLDELNAELKEHQQRVHGRNA